MFDGKAFGQEVVAAVKSHVDKSLAPIFARLDDLEARETESARRADVEAVAADVKALRKTVSHEIETICRRVNGVLADPSSEIDLDSMVKDAVAEAVSALPAAKDGASVTVEDLRPAVAEAVKVAVGALPVAKDGTGLASMLIDRDGALVATMTDGAMKELGRVVGKDVDMAAVDRLISEKVAQIPAPKNGTDGVGFDDLDVVQDGERSFILRFTKGDLVKEFTFSVPVVLDRGVYKADHAYEPGDGVTYGGSFWIAQEKTSAKPDGGQGWRLAVKRGRDGKSVEPELKSGPVRVGVPGKAS